jgi:hypothetical protein
MKKPNIFDMLADFEVKDVDPESFTCRELAAAAKCTVGRMGKQCSAMVKSGKWKKTWKRVGRQIVPSYRLK